VAQRFDIVGPDQHMVVVGQDTPGVRADRKLLTRAEQVSFKVAHAFVADADVVFVLVAGAGDEKLSLSVELQMRG